MSGRRSKPSKPTPQPVTGRKAPQVKFYSARFAGEGNRVTLKKAPGPVDNTVSSSSNVQLNHAPPLPEPDTGSSQPERSEPLGQETTGGPETVDSLEEVDDLEDFVLNGSIPQSGRVSYLKDKHSADCSLLPGPK